MASSKREDWDDDISSFEPDHLERRFGKYVLELPTGTKRRVATTYYVQTEEAAERLASWFGRQPDITVTIQAILPTTQAELDAAAEQGIEWMEVARRKSWWVEVLGPSVTIGLNDLREWAKLLKQAPTDPAWRIGGWALATAD
jgi:hypothetical protein